MFCICLAAAIRAMLLFLYKNKGTQTPVGRMLKKEYNTACALIFNNRRICTLAR
jgi:hypothetical protein